MTAILKIKRDGVEWNVNSTTEINLIQPGTGIHLQDWRPRAAFYKDGGIYQSSPLATGRKLVSRTFDNVIETFTFSIRTPSQNNHIAYIRGLRQLLEDAANYWAGVSNEPVYIEARSSCETRSRYALVISGRIEEDENPYSQPFLQPMGGSAGRSLSLQVERGHWMSVKPGEPECIQAACIPCEEQSGVVLVNEITYRERLIDVPGVIAIWPLDETSGLVANDVSDNGYDATYTDNSFLNNGVFLDGSPTAFMPIAGLGCVDLYSSSLDVALITTMGENYNWFNHGSLGLWFNTSGPIWASGFRHVFLSMFADNGDGFMISKGTTDLTIDLTIYALENIFNSTFTVPDEEAYTNSWICIFVTMVEEGGGVRWNWYVNDVFAGTMLTPRNNGDSLDSDLCVIGAQEVTGPSTLAGASSDMAYVSFFSEPNIIDFCDTEPEQIINDIPYLIDATTCEQRYALVSNQHTYARISHLLRYDASETAYTDLETLALPYYLFPNPMTVGDMFYAGIEYPQHLAAGPFNNIVFNTTAARRNFEVIWEYWDGATWANLSNFGGSNNFLFVDNTNTFSLGQDSTEPDEVQFLPVGWTPPSDWTVRTVNGIPGYWIRVRVTLVGGTPTVPPEQRVLHPYTHRWPFLEVIGVAVRGDVPALMTAHLRALLMGTDLVSGHAGLPHGVSNIYVGLRTFHDRSELFTAYINFSAAQGTPRTSVVAHAPFSAFATNNQSPTGHSIRSAAQGTWLVRITLDGGIWAGRFRAFVRYQAAPGTTDNSNITVFLNQEDEDGTELRTYSYFTSTTTVGTGSFLHIADFGEIVLDQPINPNQNMDTSFGLHVLNISYAQTPNTGNSGLDFIDLILIPTDEWFGHFFNEDQTFRADQNNYYEFGSAFDPKSTVRSLVRRGDSTSPYGYYRSRQQTSGESILQANTRQRYWFLMGEYETAATYSFARTKVPTLASLEVYSVERFLGSRGEEALRV